MGTVASQIKCFATCAFSLFYVYSIFPSPPHHQYGKCSNYCCCILIICIYGRYLGVETMVQLLFLMSWQPISEWYFWAWKYDMLGEKQCLCSGGKNKVSVRDHDPLGSSPMGMEWMTGWYIGAPC